MDAMDVPIEALARIVGDAHVERDVRIEDASGRRHRAGAGAPRQRRAGSRAGRLGIRARRRDPAGRRLHRLLRWGRARVRRALVAIALDRLNRVRSFDPLLWRMEVEAGVTTADVQRLARENGLLFPPDPGAAEQSQIGGNLATNAGGPHAFKYGVTSRWVTGVEAVIAPGELVRFGGPMRKDVAGYDLRGLLIGSEGTLGIITAAWLRFTPAPAMAIPVIGGYDSIAEGVEAIEAALASGVVPATLEYLQGQACATPLRRSWTRATGVHGDLRGRVRARA